jgi:hypothetical protein
MAKIVSGSLKLVNLIETHAEPIARQWARDVIKNPRTPSYHSIPEDKLVPVAVKFYDNFKQMFFTDKPADTSQQYFARYAEDHHARNIPLNEALYALIMMRRHIWLLCRVPDNLHLCGGTEASRGQSRPHHPHVRLRHFLH